MAAPTLTGDDLVRAFVTHGRALSAVAAAWVGRADATDLLQETARVAWQHRSKFAVGGDLRAWLMRILRNVGGNWRRRRRPVGLDEVGAEDRAAPPCPFETGFDAESLGLSDELARGLAGLSETARECLLLRVVADYTFPEIADLLGIPQNTAQSHVRRAREVLRRALESGPGGRVIPMPRSETS